MFCFCLQFNHTTPRMEEEPTLKNMPTIVFHVQFEEQQVSYCVGIKLIMNFKTSQLSSKYSHNSHIVISFLTNKKLPNLLKGSFLNHKHITYSAVIFMVISDFVEMD